MGLRAILNETVSRQMPLAGNIAKTMRKHAAFQREFMIGSVNNRLIKQCPMVETTEGTE